MGCGAAKPQAPLPKLFSFRVRVLGGLNLYNNGFGVQIPGTQTSRWNFSTKTDPYVHLQCGDNSFKTTTVVNDCNPVWNEEFVFAVSSRAPILKVRVHDHDVVSKDDSIGYAEIALHGLITKQETEIWVPLQGSKSNGEIGLSIIECYRMKVTAVGGTEVEAKDALSGTSDCYLTLQVGQQERRKTQVKGWTRNPQWLEDFYFYVPYTIPSMLQLVLWDHDRVKNDESMGWHNVQLTGKPRLADRPESMNLPLKHAKGTLQIIIKDETDVEGADPGPVTEAMKKKFPPSVPQTCSFKCRVVGAYNLAASDYNIIDDLLTEANNHVWHKFSEYKGNSDPFVRIECEGQKYETNHINKTLEPQWNETFRFVCRNKEESKISLEVIDYDLLANDVLGKVTVPVNMMKPGERTEMWSFLDKGRGEIGLELMQNFQLKVRIVSGENLPAKDINGLSDPVFKLCVAAADETEKKWYKTRVIRESRAPSVEEDFRFPVPTLKNTKLYIEAYDADLLLFKTSAAEELLGRCDVELDGLQPGLVKELVVPLALPGKQPEGTVKIQLLSEMPLPRSALDQLAEQGKAAFEATVKALNEKAAFIKTLTPFDEAKKQDEVIQSFDPKIDKRPRYSRIKVTILAGRGIVGASSPQYVGVAIPTQGTRYKTKEAPNAVDPEFHESFEFGVPTKTTTALELTLFESNKHPYTQEWSETTRKVLVPFRNFNNNQGLIRGAQPKDAWFPLPGGGEIGVRVEELFRFHIRLLRAEKVAPKAESYVRIFFGTNAPVRTQTQVKHPKGSPTYGEGFTFFSETKNLDVKFEIREDEIGNDGVLGTGKINLSDLRRGVPKQYKVSLDKNGIDLYVEVKEEEKMGLLDQIMDAAENTAKLVAASAGEAVGAIKGALGGLFGK